MVTSPNIHVVQNGRFGFQGIVCTLSCENEQEILRHDLYLGIGSKKELARTKNDTAEIYTPGSPLIAATYDRTAIRPHVVRTWNMNILQLILPKHLRVVDV